MIISRNKWHYKVYEWVDNMDDFDDNPSICKYWGTVFIRGSITSIIMFVAFVIFLPFLGINWLYNKGKVEFK